MIHNEKYVGTYLARGKLPDKKIYATLYLPDTVLW